MLHINTDRKFVRAGVQSTRYVRVQFTAPDATRQGTRLPLDVALVIDKSGSMGGEKLRLAKQAALMTVKLLGQSDHLALVAYDSNVELLSEGALLSEAHRQRVVEAIRSLRAGSSTNLSDGWLMGCEEVARAEREDTVARTLLLSDGLANVGITDAPTLQNHASELRIRGVATSTFGIGADFDERLMRGMARAGGGNFYFLENAGQIPDFLMSELGEALEVVARQAMLTVEVDAGVTISSLDGRRLEREGSMVQVSLDDLVARQQVELVLKVTFPRRAIGASTGLSIGLTDRDGVLHVDPVRMDWEYANHADNDAQERDGTVDGAVAERYAARAREEAAEFNRDGNLERARECLLSTAQRIRGYAGDNDMLQQLVEELELAAERHRHEFHPAELKSELFRAYNIMESKDRQGRKRRSY